MELSKEKKVIVERHNKVVYDNGDTVVKVFNGSKPAADILNEGLNLARAEQAGINSWISLSILNFQSTRIALRSFRAREISLRV